jgi:triphosphatase
MAFAEFGTETEWQFESADLAPLRAQLLAAGELAGFRLVAAGPRELHDCYVDTADRRFAQAGYALRLRTDGLSAEATLKSIGGDTGAPRVRTEIRQIIAAGDAGALLATQGPVSERVRAMAGAAPLSPLFRVRTHRDVWHALLGEVDAAEIVLDESSIAAHADADAVALQRVEVELHEASAESLQPLLEQLTADSNLAPAKRSKYQTGIHAAGLTQSGDAPQPSEPCVEPGMSAIHAGQLLLQQQLQDWRMWEAKVRLNTDDEALHQLRVCGRRIIGTLRLMERAPLAQAHQLRSRFQKMLRSTSAARDLDVQCQFVAALPDVTGRTAMQPLLTMMRRQRRREQTALLRRLGAQRTQQLLQGLDTLAATPVRQHALQTVAAVGERLMRRRYRRLRRQAQQALASGAIESVHALRLEAKKLRYLAEPLVSVYGAPLRRFLRRLRRMQVLLGDWHDGHQIEQGLSRQLARHGADLPAPAVFATGRTIALLRSRMQELQSAIPDVWRRVRGRRWRQLRRTLRKTAASTGAAKASG